MNIVMTGSGKLVEIQGTAEGIPFSKATLNSLIGLAEEGISSLIKLQKKLIEGEGMSY
jgi:ribonuclease PH